MTVDWLLHFVKRIFESKISIQFIHFVTQAIKVFRLHIRSSCYNEFYSCQCLKAIQFKRSCFDLFNTTTRRRCYLFYNLKQAMKSTTKHHHIIDIWSWCIRAELPVEHEPTITIDDEKLQKRHSGNLSFVFFKSRERETKRLIWRQVRKNDAISITLTLLEK